MQSVATVAGSQGILWRRVPASSLLLWHLCSLDAPTIAVAWAALLGRLAGVHTSVLLPQLEVLALGTWIVYVLDRVLDGIGDRVENRVRDQRRGQLPRLQERHYFHRRHRAVLLALSVLAATALFLLARELPRSLIGFYVVLAFPVGVYTVAVHSRLLSPRADGTPEFSSGRASTEDKGEPRFATVNAFAINVRRDGGDTQEWLSRKPDRVPGGGLGIKEAAVAVLFTSAVAAPAIVAAGPQQRPATGLCAFLLALLCWLNCATISHAEAPLPGRRMQRPRANRRLMVCALAVAGFAALQTIAIVCAPHAVPRIFHGTLAPAVAVLLSALLLLLLASVHAPRSGRRVRVLADLALLTPFLLLRLGS